jgi:hypothetical protein
MNHVYLCVPHIKVNMLEIKRIMFNTILGALLISFYSPQTKLWKKNIFMIGIFHWSNWEKICHVDKLILYTWQKIRSIWKEYSNYVYYFIYVAINF